MFKIIKKADIALFVVLILIGLGLSWWSAASGTQGQKVVVTVDGKLYGTYSLVENQTIEIQQNNHLNKITIKDETVQMSYSDCRNQVCVKDGKISRTNQSIVCLPNKVMVEITGGEEEYDAISN
ncbi:NusG domain II-containing protein [Emergencia sp.]|uniref:NusG domain II-containing protein n=1 Tax=Emergencia sp. TaxID=1926557 RepID=UPI003AF17BA4